MRVLFVSAALFAVSCATAPYNNAFYTDTDALYRKSSIVVPAAALQSVAYGGKSGYAPTLQVAPSFAYTKSLYPQPILPVLAKQAVVAAPVLDSPQPYSFGYKVKEDQGTQYREETGDAWGGKRGSYGYTDAWGIFRQVDYIADQFGFRATIRTNEPGTANQDPASVSMDASPSPYQALPVKVVAAATKSVPSYGVDYGNVYVGRVKK